MIFGEYDRDMDIAVNRREAKEEGMEEGHKKGREEGHKEGREEERKYFLNMLNQGLTVEEIRERLQ